MIDSVSCDFHHAVTHGSADKDTDCGYDNDGSECCNLSSDSRLQKVNRVIADADHEVENCQDEQKNNKSQIHCFHYKIYSFSFRAQI